MNVASYIHWGNTIELTFRLAFQNSVTDFAINACALVTSTVVCTCEQHMVNNQLVAIASQLTSV